MVEKIKIKIQAQDVNFYYGKTHALKDINVSIAGNSVTAIIGPSGCGKSTFIRLLNRMNELVPNTRVEGKVYLDEKAAQAAGTVSRKGSHGMHVHDSILGVTCQVPSSKLGELWRQPGLCRDR